ncbi:FAD-binding protein [Rhodococcus spongiicola]|uniref:FAD-binding protein n=2 Tax=Rhodococcus spongiicola TaxID=2487352 RepID=A0A438AQZ0_9NOCA|nr:FAD-binding protein [Rhodococcus spongiicola]
MIRAEDKVPVLIVGAGPTGLTAAVELSRLGINVRIVDKAPKPSDTSRALAIQARTVELLRPRAVGEELLRLGNPVSATTLYAKGRKLADVELHRMPSEFNYILLLAQSETERILADQCARQGVKIERGVELVSVTQNHDAGNTHDGNTVKVVLRRADGTDEQVEASYLIAADGAHSPTRKALGLTFEGTSFTQKYALGDLHLDGDLAEDQMSVFLAPRGFIAVFPMGEGRFRFTATDPDGIAGEAAEPTLKDIQRLYDRVSHVPATLHNLNWSSRFRINSRHMSTLRAGRVFFGGDAAHVHSPAGGQGMNTGIQDMINLSWKLAMVLNTQAKPELLDTYETDRLPVIKQVVRMTRRMTRVVNSTNPIVHSALTRLAPRLLTRSATQDKVTPRLGQLAATYRSCPIARHAGRNGDLHAGDRVPDMDLYTVGDDPTNAESTNDEPTKTEERRHLYDMQDLSALTLFITDTNAAIDDSYHSFRDLITVHRVRIATHQPRLRGSDVQIAEQLAAQPGWMLLRPDGYLAAAGHSADAATLARWLERWFIRNVAIAEPATPTG